MHGIDLTRTDLNLLVVLDVLLQERNVTRAARRLHRTQSATSHALARLREQLGDPLLVRVGHQMRPTPRAEALAPELTRLLGTIGRVLNQDGPFDPRRSQRVFTLAGPDFLAVGLAQLLERMSREAPRAGLELVGPSPTLFRDVVDGRVDLAVAPPREPPLDGLRSQPLCALGWAVFARRGHPAARGWGVEAWCRYPHVRVRTTGHQDSPVDRAARARGLQRSVGPTLPHFLLTPGLLARTNLLATVPHAILRDAAPGFGLRSLPCPIPVEPIVLHMFWSAAMDRDPAVTLLRNMTRAALLDAFGPAGSPSRR